MARSGPFKEKVRSLINNLLSGEPLDPAEIGKFAQDIRENYLVDPLDLLEAVAADPNARNLQGLSELEGLKSDTLVDVVPKSRTDSASWLLLKQEDQTVGLIGVFGMSEYEATGFVLMEFSKEGRVWSVEPGSRLAWVSLPSTHDWDSNLIFAVLEENGYIDLERVSTQVVPSLPSGQKRLSDLFFGWLSEESEEPFKVEPLAGTDPNVKPIALEDLQTKDPATYKNLVMELEDEFETAAMMIRRSKTFSAATAVRLDLVHGHGDVGNLRETIVQALDAAVKRDSKKRQALAAEDFSKSNWGPLAAVALKQQFAVRDVLVLADRLEASAACYYLDEQTRSIHRAKLTLARKQASPQSRWRITGFALMGPDEREQQARQAAY